MSLKGDENRRNRWYMIYRILGKRERKNPLELGSVRYGFIVDGSLLNSKKKYKGLDYVTALFAHDWLVVG